MKTTQPSTALRIVLSTRTLGLLRQGGPKLGAWASLTLSEAIRHPASIIIYYMYSPLCTETTSMGYRLSTILPCYAITHIVSA